MDLNRRIVVVSKVSIVFLLLFLSISCDWKKEKGNFTFVFLTDIHVQKELRADKGFRMVVKKVNQINPDFVITGGDLIMDALENSFEGATGQYKMFLNICAGFNMPVHHTIGNHDSFGLYKSSGISPTHPEFGKKMFKKRIGGGRTYRSFDHKGWHFIILDTISFTPEREFTGRVDPVQIEWLKMDLMKLDKNTPIAVATHIPLVSFSEQLVSKMKTRLPKPHKIKNADEILPLFNGYNLKLVLQGHLHIVEEMVFKDIHFITGGAVSGDWWRGPRGGFEEGFIKVEIMGKNFSWEYIDYRWDVNKDGSQ